MVGLGSVLWSWDVLNGKDEVMVVVRWLFLLLVVEKKDLNVSGV